MAETSQELFERRKKAVAAGGGGGAPNFAGLAEKLAASAPGGFGGKCVPPNSGVEAVESEVEIARHATGRACVDRVITERAAMGAGPGGIILRGLATGVERREAQGKTEAAFSVPDTEMQRF